MDDTAAPTKPERTPSGKIKSQYGIGNNPASRKNLKPPEERFRVRHVAQALQKAGGIVTLAAKILADAYGACTPRTVYLYLKRHPKLQEIVDQAVETNLDIAEGKLLNAIVGGQDWAVKFYLETKGKQRGYSKRTEIAGVAGQPVVVTNAREWITDQLDQMESRLRSQPGGASGPAEQGGEGETAQKTVH